MLTFARLIYGIAPYRSADPGDSSSGGGDGDGDSGDAYDDFCGDSGGDLDTTGDDCGIPFD